MSIAPDATRGRHRSGEVHRAGYAVGFGKRDVLVDGDGAL